MEEQTGDRRVATWKSRQETGELRHGRADRRQETGYRSEKTRKQTGDWRENMKLDRKTKRFNLL
jgi:hypothetical protein